MDLLPLLQATGTLVALLLLSKIWMSNNTTTNKHFIQAAQPKDAWPILGHLYLLGGQIPLFRTLAAMADQHGPIFTIRLGFCEAVVASSNPIFTIRLGFRQAVVVSSKQTVTECFTVNDRAFMSRPQTVALKYMDEEKEITEHYCYWGELSLSLF
ncbi:Xanthotoxin 5-hydroxylase CYP82C4 [Camellia lanceoleosa]|uniref:Xanthotoxin 5-hydroxylase CYP82C4 n=1 Tax=Camellia lanceoleosa TaxID=1840588 RepID=A0ACC0G5T0_9ERIC|nr:Xanthotoxin 5-hydroxylase CYP82C4 [Camellia lanceoleosa]